jgi:hypothetical protein
MESQQRESARKGDPFCSWRTRLLILGLAVSAVSLFVLTPSMTRSLVVPLEYSPVLGPLLMVADVVPGNQIFGKITFALISIFILLPVVRFRAGTVFASIFGLLAWIFLGMIGSGIHA